MEEEILSCLQHLLCLTQICFSAAMAGTTQVEFCVFPCSGCVGKEGFITEPLRMLFSRRQEFDWTLSHFVAAKM